MEAIRSREANRALAAFQRRWAPVLYQHSTVAQEILAGSVDERGWEAYHEHWIVPFEALGRVITPGHGAWKRAAWILMRLIASGEVQPGGFGRSLLNDCLVAASARDHGFVLVTRNVRDFERIRRVEPGFRYVPPWPEA